MRAFLCCSCNHSPPLPPSPPPKTINYHPPPLPFQKLLLHAAAAALSFSALVSPLPLLAANPAATLSPPIPAAGDICTEAEEEEQQRAAEAPPVSVSNEELVEEAWEVVDGTFFADAASRPWSPEIWLEKKEYIHNNSIQTRSKAHDIIQKLLASLGDPYTRFLSPSEGDEILSVNGVNVKGKSAFDVSSELQGPKETFVTVEVKHGNCGPIHSIWVQRQSVTRTPVFYRLEKMGNVSVGYVHIKEFNALARKDLITALKRLQDSGASCLVLDLRDNLGGLVQAGIEVAKLFLDKGETVIYTVGRDPQVGKNIVADTEPMLTSPIIVLVNNRTASASEIVASALHDNCKAVLVGEKTFGKGLIQSVFELLDGSGVVVTIGKYVTPNHMDINGNGIVPDFPGLPDLSEVTNYLSTCQIGRKG